MAQRFYEEATQQLAPVYQQTENALQAQLPAIQNLYQTLYQGLEGQRQTETQNILESASSRGVLRSSLPVDLQTTLGAALLGERGKLGAQEASEVAGVREKIGTLGIQRTGAIAELARALETQDLQAQELALKKLQADREYSLARSKSGSSKAPSQAQSMQLAASALARELQSVTGGDGYVSPRDYQEARREWIGAGFSSKTFEDYFAGFKNPAHAANPAWQQY